MNRMFLSLSVCVVSVVVGCSAQGGTDPLGTTAESLTVTVPPCGGGDGSSKAPFVIGASACTYAPTAASNGAPAFFTFDPALSAAAKITIAPTNGGKGVITAAQANADGSCGALLGSLDKAPDLPSVVAPAKGVCIVLGRVSGSVQIGTSVAPPPADAGAAPDVCADKTAALQAQVAQLTAQVAQLKSQCSAPAPAPSSCQAQLDAISKLVSTVQGDVSKLSAAAAH